MIGMPVIDCHVWGHAYGHDKCHMPYGLIVWRPWHIKNCAIHMFMWEGWWKCFKKYGVWKYW